MKAKESLIILVLFSSAVLSLYSQKAYKIYTGAKAGIGIPNLIPGAKSTPVSEGYFSRPGLYGGIVAEVQTYRRFGIRAELNFSSQGGRREGMQALPLSPEMRQIWQILPAYGIMPENYMYADIIDEVLLNYLELPVMAKFTFKLSYRINFYIHAGPYMGVLLNAKNITGGSSTIYITQSKSSPVDEILLEEQMDPVGMLSFDRTENITSDIRRFNVGCQGAIGIWIKMGTGKVFIEGGGNYGLLPVQKDKSNGSNTTRTATITVGYMFRL